MKPCRTVLSLLVIGLVLSAFSSRAQLNFGSGASIVGSLTDQELTGVVFPPGNNRGANDGSISTWVVHDSSLDSQGLIFVYQVVNNGPDAIDEVTLTGYGFVTSDILSGSGVYSGVGGSLSFGSTPSASGNTFAFKGQTGSNPPTVAFQDADLASGGTSDFLVVFTDINDFYNSYGEDQDDFSAAGCIQAPVAADPIPEANTIVAGALMLLPLGVGAVRAIRKEHKI